jgi:hypothetical protein
MVKPYKEKYKVYPKDMLKQILDKGYSLNLNIVPGDPFTLTLETWREEFPKEVIRSVSKPPATEILDDQDFIFNSLIPMLTSTLVGVNKPMTGGKNDS